MFEVLNEAVEVSQLHFEVGDVGNRHKLVIVTGNVASIESSTLLLAYDLHQQCLNLLDARLIHRYQFLLRLYKNLVGISLSRNFFLLHFVQLLQLSDPLVQFVFRDQLLNWLFQ